MFLKTRKRKELDTLRAENARLREDNALLTKENDELKEENVRDKLTGIGNWLMFDESIRKAAKQFITDGTDFALVFMDLNGLKAVNDDPALGHSVGNALIKAFADTLKDGKREDDIICRFGGDEFVIILPKTDLDGAKQAMVKHLQNFKNVEVTASTTGGSVTIDGISVAFGIASVLMTDEKGRHIIDASTRSREFFLNENRRRGSQPVAADRKDGQRIAEEIERTARYIASTLTEFADRQMYEMKKGMRPTKASAAADALRQ